MRCPSSISALSVVMPQQAWTNVMHEIIFRGSFLDGMESDMLGHFCLFRLPEASTEARP